MAETIAGDQPLTEAQEVRMLELMLPFAHEHAAASGGKLVVLDIDPDKYDFQIGNHYEGSPKSTEEIKGLAGIAVPEFSVVSAELQDNGAENIRDMRAALARGDNVILNVSHDGIIDTGVAGAAAEEPLRSGPDAPKFRMAISLGELVKLLGYKFDDLTIPCVDAMSYLCNDISFAIPHSKRIKNSRLMKEMPDEVAAFNRISKRIGNEMLDKGGVVFVSSLSGTTTKLTTAQKYLMGRLNTGTIEFATHKKTSVVSVGMSLSSDNPFMTFIDKLSELKRPEDVHTMMGRMATWMTEKTGRNYEYEQAAEPNS